MKRSEVLGIIKEMNIIVDKMVNLDTNSKEYIELSDALYWYGEAVVPRRFDKYCFRMSNRTGHYYVKFFD